MNTNVTLRNSLNSDLDRLLADVQTGAGQDLSVAETLPAAAYTSEAFFELEKQKIFRKEWLAIGHIAQIPNEGDYFTIDILGDPLMAVRGPDRIRVMSRTCLHRWAPVASGKGNTKLFSCPFHRWGYGLDGRLRVAPFMEKAEGFDPKKCSLPEIRSEIVLGTIYINFSGDAPELAPRLKGMIEEFAHVDMEDLIVGFSTEFNCPFNWKIAVETFMECYHHIGAHAKTLQPHSPGGLSWGEDMSRSRPGLGLPAPPAAGRRSHGVRAQVRTAAVRGHERGAAAYRQPLSRLPAQPDRDERRRAAMDDDPSLSANRTWWIRHYLVRKDARNMPNFDELMETTKANGAVIAAEDIEVNTLQQIGAYSGYAKAGRLSHLEKPVWQLADYVRDRMARPS